MRRPRSVLSMLLLALAAGMAGAAEDIYGGPAGELVLENPRVRVVRFVLPPGTPRAGITAVPRSCWCSSRVGCCAAPMAA